MTNGAEMLLFSLAEYGIEPEQTLGESLALLTSKLSEVNDALQKPQGEAGSPGKKKRKQLTAEATQLDEAIESVKLQQSSISWAMITGSGGKPAASPGAEGLRAECEALRLEVQMAKEKAKQSKQSIEVCISTPCRVQNHHRSHSNAVFRH